MVREPYCTLDFREPGDGDRLRDAHVLGDVKLKSGTVLGLHLVSGVLSHDLDEVGVWSVVFAISVLFQRASMKPLTIGGRVLKLLSGQMQQFIASYISCKLQSKLLNYRHGVHHVDPLLHLHIQAWGHWISIMANVKYSGGQRSRSRVKNIIRQNVYYSVMEMENVMWSP